MATQTIPDEQVLEQLEAELLRSPGAWPWPAALEGGAADLLAPAVGQVDDDPECRVTRIRTGRGCCDS